MDLRAFRSVGRHLKGWLCAFRFFLFRDREKHLPECFDGLGAAFRLQFQAPIDGLKKLRAKLLRDAAQRLAAWYDPYRGR